MAEVGYVLVLQTEPLVSLLFRLINGAWTNSLLDLVMPLLSLVGNWGLVWLVLLGGIALFGGAAERWAALAGLIALAAGAVISEVRKDLTMEPRPFVSLPDVRLLVDPPDSTRMPSPPATLPTLSPPPSGLCLLPGGYLAGCYCGDGAYWLSQLLSPTRASM